MKPDADHYVAAVRQNSHDERADIGGRDDQGNRYVSVVTKVVTDGYTVVCACGHEQTRRSRMGALNAVLSHARAARSAARI